MNIFVFLCVAIPMVGANFAVYFILRGKGLVRESLIAKCAGSFVAVSSAVFAMCTKGENPIFTWVFWFFVLCTVADALLEISFVPGMLVFGAAHICLILCLLSIMPPLWYSIVIWLIAYAFVAFLFRNEIPKLGKKTLPFCLYGAVLAAALALALPMPFLMGGAYIPISLGAVLFFTSDMMVAKGELSTVSPALQKPVMGLYWGALLLISVSLWLV